MKSQKRKADMYQERVKNKRAKAAAKRGKGAKAQHSQKRNQKRVEASRPISGALREAQRHLALLPRLSIAPDVKSKIIEFMSPPALEEAS